MKLDIGPLRRGYVAPDFGDALEAPERELSRRVRRPIVIGSAVIAALVLGLGLWAAVTPISSGVAAPGQLRAETNRKTLRSREGGKVKAIFVRDGSQVRAGQPLLLFDDVQPRAAYDVLRGQADAALLQNARYLAEATGRAALDVAPDLMARTGEPRLAAMMRNEQFLFESRRQLFDSQVSLLSQRLQQFETGIEGLQAQVDAVQEQQRLTNEELEGYQTLFEKGYAPKTLILRSQQKLAELGGQKGSLISEISKTREQMGETRMQMGTLRDQRQSEAADGLRQTQSVLADALPRLAAAQQTLAEATIRSPVDGYVLNLTQFTVGGIAGAGEALMDVAPQREPLVVTVMVKPQDADDIRVGMDAKVRFSGLNQRAIRPIPATVMAVSADRLLNDKTGEGFFKVDLHVDPKELARLGKGVRLTAGMPADAMIVTGKRTVLSYLLSPIADTFRYALSEP